MLQNCVDESNGSPSFAAQYVGRWTTVAAH
jgi:hypothetical protein